MMHIAMQEADDSGSPVTWGRHVTDAETARGARQDAEQRANGREWRLNGTTGTSGGRDTRTEAATPGRRRGTPTLGTPTAACGSRLRARRYRDSDSYAADWNDMRCSGETPWRAIASRCSGVE